MYVTFLNKLILGNMNLNKCHYSWRVYDFEEKISSSDRILHFVKT